MSCSPWWKWCIYGIVSAFLRGRKNYVRRCTCSIWETVGKVWEAHLDTPTIQRLESYGPVGDDAAASLLFWFTPVAFQLRQTSRNSEWIPVPWPKIFRNLACMVLPFASINPLESGQGNQCFVDAGAALEPVVVLTIQCPSKMML